MSPSPSLPAALETILDAVQAPIPTGTLRALAGVALRGRDVTAQGLGRVAAYEEESFLRSRGTPRFSWALEPNGAAISPRVWARGSWRLERRIITEDAFKDWSVRLAIFLTDRMAKEDQMAREELARVAMEAVVRVMGPLALYLPGSREQWIELHNEMVQRQHPAGLDTPTGEQSAAAKHLEEEGLTPFSLYFGIQDTVLPQSEGPPGLRLPHASEEGVPFDELVMAKTSDRQLARDVLAYVQEWGWLIDHLGRSPSFDEYAERWKIDMATARDRNSQFTSLFPSEETPDRIWNLLWEGGPGDSFVRLIGKAVVESSLPPTVINHFVNGIADELKADPGLGRKVMRAIATFEESEQSPPRELRRFFALCERTRLWSAQALVSAGETEYASGLLASESVVDNETAWNTEQMLGEYRRELPRGPHRDLLQSAQKALRVAAALDAPAPPRTTAPYLPGVQWAAKALAQTRSSQLRVDLTAEAKATVRALESVH